MLSGEGYNKPLLKARNDRALEGLEGSARPRIRVGRNWWRRLDSLQSTSSSMEANSGTHITNLFHLRDGSALPARQLYRLYSCSKNSSMP